MSDMVERAIGAALEVSLAGIARRIDEAIIAGDYPEKIKQQVRRDSAANYERSRKEAEPIMRAALLAALDPEDEALCDAMAASMHNDPPGSKYREEWHELDEVGKGYWRAKAKSALESLKAMGRGVSDDNE